jgi:FlaA1/EpsC-like NDP-sugar epimerase
MQTSAAERRIDALLALPRSTKHILAVLVDSALCVLTVWLAICFRFESWVILSGYQWLAVALSVLLAIPLLTAFGFYHTVVRYAGKQTIAAALRAMGIYVVIYSAVFTAYGLPLVPRTIGILQPLLLLVGLALVRLSASQLLSENTTSTKSQKNLPSVLIYGAGNSGQQLAASLQAKGESRVAAFLDDNASLHKARISGIPVHSPSEIHQLSNSHQIRDVLLAMPSLSRSRRNEIIKALASCQVAVRTLPSLTDLAQGKISEADLRELNVEDLLGRDPVAPIPELMARTVTGKIVLVTGAGGSIGSELCRQILALKPKHLVILDSSEFALYAIHSQIVPLRHGQQATSNIGVEAVLANVREESRIREVIAHHQPDTIFHAAAYKHVPIVESNPLEGLKNNILGTYCVAKAAIATGVKNMVLISTDKAVRPTNFMGASKRLSELCLDCLANISTSTNRQTTRFCIVRFGNVLDSSGSVLPKFRRQIESGGPITLTHPDITRYFMTIPEAAQLVIQASGLHAVHNQLSQVYLLDMGESVKIIDLAKLMIQLSGLQLRDEDHPEGDITIEITGLRPGEKLYEELLVAGRPAPTPHPKILRALDTGNNPDQDLLERILDLCLLPANADVLEKALMNFDIGYSRQNT